MVHVATEHEAALDVDAEAARLLTGAKPVASASSAPRRLLALMPMLVLAALGMMVGLTIVIGTRGNDVGRVSGGSTNLLASAKEDAAAVVNASHPESPFYQRGERFDASVSRERGVVMCMHDVVFPLGLSLIRELRCLGNHELVQVYHCGGDELSAASKELLFSSDNRVELVDVCSDLTNRGVISDDMAKKFRSWWIKPLAMYHTDVRHVMLMDVDDIFVKDPAVLRDLEGYTATGTTFFYDRVISNCRKFMSGLDGGENYMQKLFTTFNYTRFNVSGGPSPSPQVLKSFAYNNKTCHEMDSSLVLVDKARAGQAAMDVMLWFITEERFRYGFSFGDKETFWLAFEVAHAPYFFSPWGVSVVSSSPNKDMKEHPDTLCGSILQYLPVHGPEEMAEMLYVNGKALVDPYPQGVDNLAKARRQNLYNTFPTHMMPRQPRTATNKSAFSGFTFTIECMVGLGSTPLPDAFAGALMRRRLHFLGVTTGVLGSLQHCETYEL
ncbi:hypothetical protein BBJ28_00017406 [Nothophytophthora sp. Chile5]|nr:hypothetical protein BBJ28_00017406 [Nothophytophthora sp. Chile5]